MVDRHSLGDPFVGKTVELLVMASLVQGHLDPLGGGAYLELGLRRHYSSSPVVVVHLGHGYLRGTHSIAIRGHVLDLSCHPKATVTGMVRFEGVRTDERARTAFFHGRVALLVPRTPAADTFVGIALLTGGDHPAVVVVGRLLYVTGLSDQVTRLEIRVDHLGPGPILVLEHQSLDIHVVLGTVGGVVGGVAVVVT